METKQAGEDTSLCKHRCKHKASCGHKCCKKNVSYGAISISTNTPTAATKVFAIPELLVQILGFLPATNILFATRVCKGFKDSVDHSFALKQQLWKAYDDKAEQTVWVLEEGALQRSYRLKRDILFDITEYQADSLSLRPLDHCIPMIPNTLLFDEHEDRNALTFDLVPQKSHANMSCGDMYLTMPPAQKVNVMWRKRVIGGLSFCRVPIEIQEGIKFKDVIERSYEKFGSLRRADIDNCYIVSPRAIMVEDMEHMPQPKFHNTSYVRQV